MAAAMVALHERCHHRAPVTAKTSMMGDDLLVCVLFSLVSAAAAAR